MPTVDTYTVNCPVPPGPTVYSYAVRLDNSTSTICFVSPTTVYSTSVLLTVGDIIYYDSGLTTLVTGYNYVVRTSGPPDIYDLDAGTGTLVADTGLDC